MKSKLLIYLPIGLLVFFTLVYYNFLLAQKAIKDTKPAPLSIDLVSFPEAIPVGGTANFVWKVDASPDLSTSFTTIYWGSEASPGALIQSDSPQAVGYPNFLPDYTTGNFSIPNTFDLDLRFDKPGKVYFRGFARVKDGYLWTEEKNLEVIK